MSRESQEASARDEIVRALAHKARRADGASRRRLTLYGIGGKNLIPGYDSRSSESCRIYAAAARSLESEGAIEIVWTDRYETIIEKILLNADHREAIMQEAGVTGVSEVQDRETRALRELSKAKGAPWLAQLATDILSGTGGARSPLRVAQLEGLILIAEGLEEFGGDVSQRELSQSVFGDSKHFERKLRAPLCRAWRLAYPEDADCSDADICESLGLRSLQQIIRVAGPLEIELSAGVLDMALAGEHGLGIPEGLLADSTIRAKTGTRAVLVVENLANYQQACREKSGDTVVVYGGGQLTSAQMALIRSIDESLPADAPRRAWSDIDLGGFRIVDRLMGQMPRFTPWRMGLEELESADRTKMLSRDERYCKTVRAYGAKTQVFKAECEWIAEHRCTLEQESLL